MVISCLAPAKEEHFASFYFRQMNIHGYPLRSRIGDLLVHSRTGRLKEFRPDQPVTVDIPTVKALDYIRLRTHHSLHPLIVLDMIFNILRADDQGYFTPPLRPVGYVEKKDNSKLYFCSSCMGEALNNQGWAFYKRLWAHPEVVACPAHRTYLSHTGMNECKCYAKNYKLRFSCLLSGFCPKCNAPMWPAQNESAPDNDVRFARWISKILGVYSITSQEPFFAYCLKKLPCRIEKDIVIKRQKLSTGHPRWLFDASGLDSLPSSQAVLAIV